MKNEARNTNPDRMWKLRYSSREIAKSVVAHMGKTALVLGDDGYHWVMTMADASRLERAGYTVEYLPR